MSMNETHALEMSQRALNYLERTDPGTLAWARNVDFRNLTLKIFLFEYCWVVYASGFKAAILEEKFPDIQTAFKEFEPAKLSRMRSIKGVLRIFNSERKAKCFLMGAQSVIQERFGPFRKRLVRDGITVLEDLPGIGPITKNHLAKNIGLADVPKADIWLERAAKLCHANSVEELTSFIAAKLCESQHVIDVAIWTYGKDGLLYKCPSENLSSH